MNPSVKRACQLIKKSNLPRLHKFYTVTHIHGEEVNVLCNIGGIMKAQEEVLIRFYNFENKEFEYEKFAIFANQLCQRFTFTTLNDIAAATEILNLNEYGFLLPVENKMTASHIDRQRFNPIKMQIINHLLSLNPVNIRSSGLNIDLLNKILRHLSMYQDRDNLIHIYPYKIDAREPALFTEQNAYPHGCLNFSDNYRLFGFIRNWQGPNGETEEILNHFIKA